MMRTLYANGGFLRRSAHGGVRAKEKLMDERHQKKEYLENELKRLGSVAVAFSSGVDSSFLLKTAHDVLGDRAIAVTVRSCCFPQREEHESTEFCKKENIRQILLETDPLSLDGFAENPPDRCYLCKRDLFLKMLDATAKEGAFTLVEGSNADDVNDYRPGMTALAQLGIKSPLKDAKLTKSDIRILSEELGLTSWNKPSFACLATRFPYGETITKEKLDMVEKAEQYLLDLGFRQVRVRMHGSTARIEIDRSAFQTIVKPEISAALTDRLRRLGFLFVALDLDGYRTGSMNKELEPSFADRQETTEKQTR